MIKRKFPVLSDFWKFLGFTEENKEEITSMTDPFFSHSDQDDMISEYTILPSQIRVFTKNEENSEEIKPTPVYHMKVLISRFPNLPLRMI